MISVATFIAAALNKNLALATNVAAVGAGSFCAMIALPILRFVNTHRCYRQMYPPTRTSATSTIEIDEHSIVEVNPGTADIRLPWSGVLDFAQDEKVTLIYISTHRFFCIPASALSPSQRTELVDLVARHVVKR